MSTETDEDDSVRGRLWNRFALTGGRFTQEEEDAYNAKLDEREGIVETEVGGIDINPMNYIASAATGAFGGILSKADQDLEDVQRSLRKKKKKKKLPDLPVPEPEQAAPPPPPRATIGAMRTGLRAMQPWYRKAWVPFAAAGTAVVAIGAVALRRR